MEDAPLSNRIALLLGIVSGILLAAAAFVLLFVGQFPGMLVVLAAAGFCGYWLGQGSRLRFAVIVALLGVPMLVPLVQFLFLLSSDARRDEQWLALAALLAFFAVVCSCTNVAVRKRSS